MTEQFTHEQVEAVATLRFDRFSPPCWQVWDGSGERLIAAFATKQLLHAALPSIREYLERSHG